MKFTGHERDLGNAASAADDLDYMHARHTSPLTGRFLSFDPIGGNARRPQSWNRYAYVLGNPLKYTDPYGLSPRSGETITITGKDPCPGTPPGYPCPLLLPEISEGPPLPPGVSGVGQTTPSPAHAGWPRPIGLADLASAAEQGDTLSLSLLDDAAAGGEWGGAEAGVIAFLTPGPFDDALLAGGGALLRPGLVYSEHASMRMAQRGVSEAMVNVAVRKGTRFWDPKHKTVMHVLRGGMASGKSLAVGRNPVTGQITTVMVGNRAIRPRWVAIN